MQILNRRPHRRFRAHSRRGFTLIEVVIALAVAAIGLAAVTAADEVRADQPGAAQRGTAQERSSGYATVVA